MNGELDFEVPFSERGYTPGKDTEEYRIGLLTLEQMLHEVHALGLKGDVDSRKVAAYKYEIELRAHASVNRTRDITQREYASRAKKR